ncbi:MAG: collagen-like protein [Bacteroidota bacterium]
MRKITLVFGALLALFMISCDGEDGFDGQDGLNGEDGIQGQVFEVENVGFDYIDDVNLHSSIITFSDFTSFETLAQDAVLVYRFDGTVPFGDGSNADAWSLIPQSFFLPEGTIQYTASHTLLDVEILIDGNFDLINLDPEFTQNQIFRIVIIPSDFAQSKVDTSNIGTVMSSLNIGEDDVQQVNLN